MNEACLTDREHDLLLELFNIGIGTAAASLGMLSKQEVGVEIPEIEIVSFSDFISSMKNDELCCVIQKSHGDIDSISMLVFPQEGTFEIVRRMLGKHIDNIPSAELYQDAIREIGNIMLNACMGSIANVLSVTLENELPVLQFGTPEEMLHSTILGIDEMLLDVTIRMRLMESDVSGSVVFIMGPFSLKKLKQSLKPLLDKITNQ